MSRFSSSVNVSTEEREKDETVSEMVETEVIGEEGMGETEEELSFFKTEKFRAWGYPPRCCPCSGVFTCVPLGHLEA
jgi:hypothetical protein